MKASACLGLAILTLSLHAGASVASAQTEWMQPGVRLWYLGGVGDWDMSSNAEEAYLIESVNGTTATVRHHSALTQWTAPKPVETGNYSLLDMGPCWMHPQRLQTIKKGDHWRGDQYISVVEHQTYTYETFPYRLLPAKALFDLAPQREFVKLTYTIDPRYATTGNAWFDAETGVLLYHHAMWGGTKMFFILAEINYDFQQRVAFPEDDGPHTGFRSFVRESSQGYPFMVGGGSVVIQSLVESRYGSTVVMLVLPSIMPSNFSTAYRDFAFFGDVPIVRQMQYPQSGDVRPEQWTPFGLHLWWWLPPTVTGAQAGALGAMAQPAINVFDVPMAKTADQPLTYTATQTPQRFHFTMLKFDADGYMVEFAARDPATGLHVRPGDYNYWNCKGMVPPGDPLAACVDGRDYFRQSMALPPQPVPTVASIFPAAGPTTGGTPITITGTHFVAGSTTVTVGGVPASGVAVQSATSLTCVTPPGAAGARPVHVIVALVSSTAPGTFVYADAAPVTPPADPSQPVTVSLAVPGGTMGATFRGVTTGGSLMAVPVSVPAPPIPQVTFLPNSALSVEAPGVTYASATFCFPYDEAAVATAGLSEEQLMVWHQPAGSPRWVDVTASHDAAANRVCALDSVSQVVIAGVSGAPLANARYLAEGASTGFFDTTIALVNLSSTAAADTILRFQRTDTTLRLRYVAVPPLGRRTVFVKGVPEMGDAQFSTVIESTAPLVVDRTMSWDAGGYGAHAETSVAAPAITWYLAEGATHSGFNLFYLIQNPHPTETAEVRVRYLLPDGPPLEKVHRVPPHSRYNVWVNHDQIPEDSGQEPLASTDVSAVLESLNGVAVIVERAMYLDRPGQFFAAGHESAGVTAPALQWFLAEGATGPFFDLFILVANPTDTDARVEATYLRPDGSTITRPYDVAANSRFNIWVDLEGPELADTAVSTTLRSVNDVPIIVERAMWWQGLTWYEAHNSPGITSTGTKWAIAEGQADESRNLETYILVANTSNTPADVKVTILFEDGTTVTNTYTAIPAHSRFDVPVGYFFPQAAGKRFGALVESVGDSPAQIVVERAMYWDVGGQFWAAGTNAVATKLQ